MPGLKFDKNYATVVLGARTELFGLLRWRRAAVRAGDLRSRVRGHQAGQQASAWLQTLPELGNYRVPGLKFDKNYATVVLGARTELFGLQNFGLSASTGQKRAQDATLFANFSGTFCSTAGVGSFPQGKG